jgi:hypothetical protein
MSQQLRTPEQKAIVERLVNRFGIDGRKVIFFPEDPNYPWLKASLLKQIARQSGKFKHIGAEFVQFIEPLKQLVYQGNVVGTDGCIYSLPGIATIGERLPEAEEVFDEHDLAEARALRSTFDLAGVDPLDPTSVVPLNAKEPAPPRDPQAAETLQRLSDNARIHILARDKRLIVDKDFSGYRKFIAEFLNKKYDGRETVAGFDVVQRKSLIEALERYVPSRSSALDVPPEFAEVADDVKGVPV